MRKDRVIGGREVQDLTQFINKISMGKPYVVTNFQELRNIDGNQSTLADTINVLATLIADLKKKGIIGE